ncbi:venom allergen 5-like [Atheta coriaria]|uniref:venom allergen 5-like n=1 Tax=Dalotia coriaria TaxID=877792 RepID=UPI0031F3C402
MITLTLILLLPFQLISSSQKADMFDYCAQHERNTPCMYHCVRSSKCGHTGTSYQDLNNQERELIIHLHNLKRARLATGNGISLLPPKLPRYIPVSYDKECEFIAGCFAKQCSNHPDKMRIALDSTRLGQNRYIFSMRRGSQHTKTLSELRLQLISAAIHSWFNPGLLLPEARYSEIHDSYVPVFYPQRTATFTQMVWEKTLFVGCAIMHSVRDTKWDMYEVLCNYRPEGNIVGQKVYTIDNEKIPCTPRKSGSAFVCENYIRNNSDDNYDPPVNLNMAWRISNGAGGNIVQIVAVFTLVYF